MRIEEVIGQRMKDVRELNELTQEQVGEQLGTMLGKPWSRQAVSMAEQGRRAFTAAELLAIASVVGTTVSRLFTPPLHARDIEMPSGETLSRAEVVDTTLPRISADEMVDGMRETLRILAAATVATNQQNEVMLSSVKTLADYLELVAQTLTLRVQNDHPAA